jgi:hypothetical protein
VLEKPFIGEDEETDVGMVTPRIHVISSEHQSGQEKCPTDDMIRVGFPTLEIFRIRDISLIGTNWIWRIEIAKAWQRFLISLSSDNNENKRLNPKICAIVQNCEISISVGLARRDLDSIPGIQEYNPVLF